MEPEAAKLPPGFVFEDRYEVLGELGSGSFGRVYRARQLSTGQSVAIKLLTAREGTESSTGREAERFRRETQICAALSHANIVQLIDSGEAAEGQLYAVFAYVPGETLAQTLASEGSLSVSESVRLMTQVLEALAAAHAQGIVHRDLTPANLILSDAGVRRTALVLDFGLGGLAEEHRRKQWEAITQSREFLGTPLYAAPEQLAGVSPTPRADLYAWGLIFLECLTGRHPFAGEGAIERLLTGGGVVEIPDWLRDHRLGELLEKVTARESEKRDVSVESLLEALDAIAGGGELPVAPEVSATPAPLTESGERRHLTVMSCDIVGSVALSQRLDAEAYREIVQSYQARAAGAVERYGGRVARYLDDALLVYFGYPQAHEDDAERAVRAGREVLREVETLRARIEAEHGVRIAVRLGIHTGPAVIGEIGGGAKQETLALGDTPKVAARLQEVAEPETLVISDATRRLVAGLFVTEDLGTPALKGISQPIRVHRVLQPSGVTSRLDRAPTLTPFVGREQELGLLLDRFEQAQEGRGQAVVIAGEAGIGKSRLVHHLREQLRETPHSWLECHTSPYTQSSALHPLIETLEEALDFEEEDSSEARLERLERGLALVGIEPAETVPLFASLLSLRLPERYAPLEITPLLQRQKTLEALLAWLLALGEKQPLVLVVEDLHWIDPSTLEWLGLLIEQCPTANVLLVLTHRPEFEPLWSGREHLHAITLSRLNLRQSQDLVAHLIADSASSAELIERIASRSDGVPLFIEELAQGAVESGRNLSGSLSGLEIPETLHDSLMARLDRLGEAKQVAQLGAALGREFPYALLEAVVPLKESALRDGLGRLVEAELVYQRGLPPKATYTFKHALVHDTAYQSLLEGQLQELHGRIADALEVRFIERVTRQPEEIARHCDAAGRTAQAIGHYQRAGERATQDSAYAEALSHLDRAMELLGTLPESTERDRQELSLQTRLGTAWGIIQMASPEAEQAYFRARHLSEQLDDVPELHRSLYGLASLQFARTEFDRANELVEEMLRLARRMRDPAQLLAALSIAGECSVHRGEFTRAREHLDEAIGLYDPQDYRAHPYPFTRGDPGITVLGASSWALWSLGYPDQALARIRELQTLAREHAHPYSQAAVGLYAPAIHKWRGEFRATLEMAEAGMAFASERGFLFYIGVGALWRGMALLRLGQFAEGSAGLRAIPSVMQRPGVLEVLAEEMGKAGQVEEGLAVVAEARALVASSGDRIVEAEVHRVEGELLLALPRPDPAQAEAAFREALEVARRQSARSRELRAATSLARLWQQQGRKEEARALLAPVYDWFTEGFDTADLKNAKALLDEMS